MRLPSIDFWKFKIKKGRTIENIEIIFSSAPSLCQCRFPQLSDYT
jgi:hypothetical protein